MRVQQYHPMLPYVTNITSIFSDQSPKKNSNRAESNAVYKSKVAGGFAVRRVVKS